MHVRNFGAPVPFCAAVRRRHRGGRDLVDRDVNESADDARALVHRWVRAERARLPRRLRLRPRPWGVHHGVRRRPLCVLTAVCREGRAEVPVIYLESRWARTAATRRSARHAIEIGAAKSHSCSCERPTTIDMLHNIPVAGFMNRRRLCQLTATILTSDLTTYYMGFVKRHGDYHVTIQRRVDPIRWTRAWRWRNGKFNCLKMTR